MINLDTELNLLNLDFYINAIKNRITYIQFDCEEIWSFTAKIADDLSNIKCLVNNQTEKINKLNAEIPVFKNRNPKNKFSKSGKRRRRSLRESVRGVTIFK